jgi:hypothetical protein
MMSILSCQSFQAPQITVSTYFYQTLQNDFNLLLLAFALLEESMLAVNPPGVLCNLITLKSVSCTKYKYSTTLYIKHSEKPC